MTPEDSRRIYNKVIDNKAKLDACPQHFFTIDLSPERTLGKHWACAKCDGEVDALAKYWYELGATHLRNSVRDT